MTANSQGIWGHNLKISDLARVIFIPALGRMSNAQLAEAFDNIDFIGEAIEVLHAIQLMDSSIEQVKTFRMGESALYLSPLLRIGCRFIFLVVLRAASWR